MSRRSDWQLSLLLHWYDRNPKSIVDHYYLSDAPHALKQRLTYTCPAKKITMIEILNMGMTRYVAADTLGIAQSYVKFTPKGESGKSPLFLNLIKNVVGDSKTVEIGTTLTMYAGDLLEIWSIDLNTGGRIINTGGYKGTQFDVDPAKSFVYKKDPIPEPDIQQPKTVKGQRM